MLVSIVAFVLQSISTGLTSCISKIVNNIKGIIKAVPYCFVLVYCWSRHIQLLLNNSLLIIFEALKLLRGRSIISSCRLIGLHWYLLLPPVAALFCPNWIVGNLFFENKRLLFSD